MKSKMVVILGPTASGKTRLAALLADKIDGEIISADSRQVYRKMDLGTGKDLDDYFVDGRQIHVHLINIVDAGEKYDLFRYKNDVDQAIELIRKGNKLPILCGGSGMYIEAALGLYELPTTKIQPVELKELENKTEQELTTLLMSLRTLHNTTDLLDRNRIIKAIEIALTKRNANITSINRENKNTDYDNLPITNLIYGVKISREIVRERITMRLDKRIKEGLIDEVKALINEGVPLETLNYYGLEYRYVSLYLTEQLTFNDMFNKLNIAIHQFAKRQMTWFRRMEKRGIKINWLPPDPEVFINSIIRDLQANAES